MGLGSLGNRVGTTSHIAVLSSIIPALYFFIKPFTSIGTSPGDLKGAPHQQFALALSMFVALVIIAERLRQFIHLFVASNEWLGSGSWMAKFVSRGLTGTEFERLEAASYKINRMLRNACDITRDSMNEEQDYHYEAGNSSSRSLPRRVVANYFERKEVVEKVGGHLWVWKQIKTRSLYRKEGLHFSARLLAANIMQFVIIICEWPHLLLIKCSRLYETSPYWSLLLHLLSIFSHRSCLANKYSTNSLNRYHPLNHSHDRTLH
jgi:hypothetical protein